MYPCRYNVEKVSHNTHLVLKLIFELHLEVNIWCLVSYEVLHT